MEANGKERKFKDILVLVAFVGILGHIDNVTGFSTFQSPVASRQSSERIRHLHGPSFGLNDKPKDRILALSAARFRDAPDLTEEDEDGVVSIPVKEIERDWTWTDDKRGEYVADGSFNVDFFVPDGTVKGAAFFMHGFSQYPVAYRKTLKQVADEANIAIIAVETGVTSGIVLRDVTKQRTNAQFALQRAVAKDTEQCIQMVMDRDEPFAQNIPENVPLGLCGHSMGGGLCYAVAAQFPSINYVFTFAPAFGEPEFDPIKAGVEKRAVDNSMLLAGTWDNIAPAQKVKEISAKSNDQNGDSSLYVPIEKGVHTGFQDKIVLFALPLSGLATVVLNLWSLSEIIILQLFKFFRTNTGQLEATRTLMSYFFTQMANGKEVTPEDALAAVENDPDLKEIWKDKADDISYAKE